VAAAGTKDITADAPAASTAPPPTGGKRARRKSGPQPFDFRRPSKFSRDHARALQIVNETFARQFTTILSTTLRSVSQVSVASIDHVSYDEYVRSCPDPSFLAILNVDPLPGAACCRCRSTSPWRPSTACSAATARATSPSGR
jgi:flagellar motor switch protein FliM